jgi:competence protein ComEC
MDKKKIFLILSLLLIFDIFIWQQAFSDKDYNTIDFLDVGQGEASLINFSNSGKILIDAGAGDKILNELGNSLNFFDKKIEVMIVSHPDIDHYGGFFEVVKRYSPSVFVYNGFSFEDKNFNNLLNLIKKKGIKILELKRGDSITIGENVLKIISPEIEQKDDNENSLVISANIEKRKILWTGDVNKEILESLKEEIGKIDIMKISHHGSKTGTNQKIIEEFSPQISLIGVGENNRYNHPVKEVINWLNYIKSDIFRTDEYGSIRIELKEKLKIEDKFF